MELRSTLLAFALLEDFTSLLTDDKIRVLSLFYFSLVSTFSQKYKTLIWESVCLSVSVSMGLCLCISVSVGFFVCVSVFVHVSVCLCVHVSG